MRIQAIHEKGGVRGFLLNLLGVFLVLALAALWAWRQWGHPPARPPLAAPAASSPNFQDNPAEATDQLLGALNQKLRDLDLLKLLDKEVQTSPITLNGKVCLTYWETFRLPLRYSDVEIDDQLKKVAEKFGVGAHLEKDTLVFEAPIEITFSRPEKPEICLIIDDGGYQRALSASPL